MDWIDTVVALPTIGIAANTKIALATRLWPVLEVATKAWDKDGSLKWRLEPGPISVRVRMDHGPTIVIDSTQLVFQYEHRFNYIQRHRGRPKLEPTTMDPLSFTDAVKELQRIAAPLLAGLSSVVSPHVSRIGLVADLSFPSGSAPPGIEELRCKLAGALGPAEDTILIDATILRQLKSGDDGVLDRCHYAVQENSADDPGGFSARLDFQRLWAAGATGQGALEVVDCLEQTIATAMEHFEDVGSGEAWA